VGGVEAGKTRPRPLVFSSCGLFLLPPWTRTHTRHPQTHPNRTHAHDIAKAQGAFAFSGGVWRRPRQPGQSHIPLHASLLVCGLDLSIDRSTCQPGQPMGGLKAPLSHVHTHASLLGAKPLHALVWSPAFLSSTQRDTNHPLRCLLALVLAHAAAIVGPGRMPPSLSTPRTLDTRLTLPPSSLPVPTTQPSALLGRLPRAAVVRLPSSTPAPSIPNIACPASTYPGTKRAIYFITPQQTA